MALYINKTIRVNKKKIKLYPTRINDAVGFGHFLFGFGRFGEVNKRDRPYVKKV